MHFFSLLTSTPFLSFILFSLHISPLSSARLDPSAYSFTLIISSILSSCPPHYSSLSYFLYLSNFFLVHIFAMPNQPIYLYLHPFMSLSVLLFSARILCTAMSSQADQTYCPIFPTRSPFYLTSSFPIPHDTLLPLQHRLGLLTALLGSVHLSHINVFTHP